MSPNPEPPPEESSLTARHRPILGDLATGTTEADLWALDDDLDDDAPPVIQPIGEAPRAGSRDIPAPRERKAGGNRMPTDPAAAPAISQAPAEERIRMNVGKVSNKNRRQGDVIGPAKPKHDFDDLEQWDDAESRSEDLSLDDVSENDLEIVSLKMEEPTSIAPTPAPAAVSSPEPPQQAEQNAETDDEYSPVARPGAVPISLRPHLGLTKTERIGSIALLALLIIAGGSVYFLSINRLPKEALRAQSNDFPIQGKRIAVHSAKSYWRAPISEGPDRDIFRRGSELLPVVEISLKGGPAAIKVVFRDENRQIIGDAITRAVQGESTVKIAGTAGFDDMGMYAAYRTGGNKPWTIEVMEAASAEADSTEFGKIFEMDISTALH